MKKKHWYGNKQKLMFFELHKQGELRYYKHITNHKGTIVIGAATNIRKTRRTQITLSCERTNK